MNIYVGNLPTQTAFMELKALFDKYGKVATIEVIKNDTSDGHHALVSMTSGGEDALDALDGHDFKGNILSVNQILTDTPVLEKA